MVAEKPLKHFDDLLPRLFQRVAVVDDDHVVIAVDSQRTARCLKVPARMFDRGACAPMLRAETPRVELSALVRLKALLAEIIDHSLTASTMVGARHS